MVLILLLKMFTVWYQPINDKRLNLFPRETHFKRASFQCINQLFELIQNMCVNICSIYLSFSYKGAR